MLLLLLLFYNGSNSQRTDILMRTGLVFRPLYVGGLGDEQEGRRFCGQYTKEVEGSQRSEKRTIYNFPFGEVSAHVGTTMYLLTCA